MASSGWSTSSGGWLAMLFGLAVEGAAIWLFDRLPLWAQILVLGPPVVLFVVGMTLVVRDRMKRRAAERARPPRSRPPGARNEP